MAKIEYRVRPVVRYVLTRYVDAGHTGESSVLGEFHNEGAADNACNALRRQDDQAAMSGMSVRSAHGAFAQNTGAMQGLQSLAQINQRASGGSHGQETD